MRVFCVIALAFATASLGCATLIGVAYDPNLPANLGHLYTIDPISGAVSPVGLNFFLYGLADSPIPGTVFGSSPVNIYTLDLQSGATNPYNGWGDLELAYDGQHNVMYGSNYSTLLTLPLCHATTQPLCGVSQDIGDFNAVMWALGYVPGEGLYGVDANTGALYRIDTTTAALTLIGNTGIGLLTGGLAITDIEYDPATGLVIAAAGGPEPFLPNASGPPLPFGEIYRLDLSKASVTLLNDRAPNFFGLAETVPEPGSLALVAGAAALLALKLRRR